MPSRLTTAALQLACAAARLEAVAAVAGVAEMDPIQAVALVVDAAIAAGADLQQVVATVNTAGTMRGA